MVNCMLKAKFRLADFGQLAGYIKSYERIQGSGPPTIRSGRWTGLRLGFPRQDLNRTADLNVTPPSGGSTSGVCLIRFMSSRRWLR